MPSAMLANVLASIRSAVPPIHPEGRPFIAIFALVTLALFAFTWQWLGWLAAGLTIWCVAFFRDPVRVTPIDADLVVAPADGRVSGLGPAVPPPELGLGDTPLTRVSIFMSVFDCHVNRAPVSGTVTKIAYTPGAFFNADLDKASEKNERNGLVIDSAGRRFAVVQIAGLIARRIVSFVGEGARLSAGERFGLIRFGSRVDVYLPEGVVPSIALGQRAVAGETVLADLRRREAPPPVRTG